MHKRVLWLFLLLFITGCSNNEINEKEVKYELNISDTFDEKITIGLSKEADDIAKKYEEEQGTYIPTEYNLLRTDIYPIRTSEDDIYLKKVERKEDHTNVILKYNYPEQDFLRESFMYKCFEKSDLKSYDDHFILSLSGEFFCLTDFDKVNINVKTYHEIYDSNGVKTEDGYSWTIDKTNYKDVDIKYSIVRDFDSMAKMASTSNADATSEKSNNIKPIIISIIAIVLFGTVYFIYRSKNNKN